MATQQTTTAGRILVAPSVILLFAWMIFPLVRTLYFSVRFTTTCSTQPTSVLSGLQNYTYFLTDPNFVAALVNTLILVGAVLVISVVRRHPRRAADGPAHLRAERRCG